MGWTSMGEQKTRWADKRKLEDNGQESESQKRRDNWIYHKS